MRDRFVALLIFVACAGNVIAQPPPHDGRHDVRHLLKMIPAEASTVLVVRSMTALDELLHHGATDASDPTHVGRLRQWLQIADGLNENGAAAVVVLPTDGAATPVRRLAILLPTTDAARMTVLWSPQKDQAGLMRGTVAGRPGFWRDSAGFVVAGPNRESVASVIGANGNLWDTLDPSTRERVARSPVSLWINNAGSRRNASQESFHGLPVELLGIPPLKFDSISRAFVTVEPTTEGILAKGRYWRTATAGDPDVANTTAPLVHVPDGEQTAFAFGMSGGGTAKHLQSACQPMLTVVSLLGIIEPGRLGDFDKLFPWIVSNTDAVSIALTPLGSDDRATLGIAIVLSAKGNAAGVKEKLAAGVDWLKTKPFSSKTANRAMDHLVHRRAAESINGVVVDHVTVDIGGDAGNDSGQSQWTANGAAWGDDPTIRIGAPTGDKILICMGGGADRFRQMASTLRQQDHSSTGRIIGTGAQSPHATSRIVEGFVHLGNWSKLVPLFSGAASIGKTKPPGATNEAVISFTAGAASSTATSFEVFVPNEMLPWIR